MDELGIRTVADAGCHFNTLNRAMLDDSQKYYLLDLFSDNITQCQ